MGSEATRTTITPLHSRDVYSAQTKGRRWQVALQALTGISEDTKHGLGLNCLLIFFGQCSESDSSPRAVEGYRVS